MPQEFEPAHTPKLTPVAPANQEHGFRPESAVPATPTHTDTPVLSAGGALLFGAVTYHLSSRQHELTSELLCWVLLPVVFGALKRGRNILGRDGALPLFSASAGPSQNESLPSISLWLVAICIAICSAFRAEIGIIILFPALVVLLAIGHKHLRPGLYSPMLSVSFTSFPNLLTQHMLGIILSSLFAIAALTEWDPLGFAISAAPTAALFVVFTLLTPQVQSGRRSVWFRSFDLEAAVWPLSLRVAAILLVMLGRESYVVGFHNTGLANTLTLGAAKAITWYFASQLAQNTSWVTATMASTFSLLATRDPFSQETDARALMAVVASLISLSQTIYMLPKQAKGKLALLGLAAIPLLPYSTNLAAIQLARSSALVNIETHPVEVLIRQAKAHFDDLRRNQSTSYSAAYDEYQRRYGFEPPHGFEEWYNFAVSHNSPIIDEFDILSEGIAPFLQLSGKEVHDSMTLAYDGPDHELWKCTTNGQPAKTQCTHHNRQNDRNNALFFDIVTEQIPNWINVDFFLNHLDEPTVLIPPPSPPKDAKEAGVGRQRLNFTNISGQRAWESLTQYCNSSLITTRPVYKQQQQKSLIDTHGLPFVTDRRAALDLCEHAEYSEMHGLLVAPESLLLTEGLVPVLSTGAPSTMGDILYPSAAYLLEERFRYKAEHDVEWEKKRNNLYWAGSMTGGHARNDGSSGTGGTTLRQWQTLHRQRFVELAQNLRRQRPFTYLREPSGRTAGGLASRAASWFLNGRLYDVAFTKVLQCDAEPCQTQRRYFRNKLWADGDRVFDSRLVFDLDGNGISGRYYKLLASRSAPLKQTLLREWHDDRLLPWVHYIPVSQGMEELPELVFYLTSTESGRARAKEIADQGHDWFTQAFREIDIVIYIYRLLLELTRLQDPGRPASRMVGIE